MTLPNGSCLPHQERIRHKNKSLRKSPYIPNPIRTPEQTPCPTAQRAERTRLSPSQSQSPHRTPAVVLIGQSCFNSITGTYTKLVRCLMLWLIRTYVQKTLNAFSMLDNNSIWHLNKPVDRMWGNSYGIMLKASLSGGCGRTGLHSQLYEWRIRFAPNTTWKMSELFQLALSQQGYRLWNTGLEVMYIWK